MTQITVGRGREPHPDHRRRLAMSSVVLAFAIGTAAIGYAVGALPL